MEATFQKHLLSLGPNYSGRLIQVELEGEWAHGVVILSQNQITQRSLHILGHRLPDGTWQALMPQETDLYTRWLEAIPLTLIDQAAKSRLTTEIGDALRLSPATSETHMVLFSDSDALYSYSVQDDVVNFLGSNLQFPNGSQFTWQNDVYNAEDWTGDISLTEGYDFYHGLISPSGEELVYVEALCSEEKCQADYNVWIIGGQDAEPQRLFGDEAVTDGLLLDPVAWSDRTRQIVFDAYEVESEQPFESLYAYDLGQEMVRALELGPGGYNGRVWLSPNQRFLLFPGRSESPTSTQDATPFRPTTSVKIYDLQADEIRKTVGNPAGGEYFVHGWVDVSLVDGIASLGDEGRAVLSVPPATSGFQRPMTNDHYGYQWLSWTETSIYHPGDDYNGPGSRNDDCYTDIHAVGNGRVKYVNLGGWGTIIIEHDWQGTTVYSQYGHVYSSLVSVGDEVTKGQHIAEMGNTGTTYCHLHWEIREADHPDPNDGSYYVSSVLSNLDLVNNYYEDPEWWVDNHGPYSGDACAAPTLLEPADGAVLTNNTITFRWEVLSGCTFDGYTFRVCTSSNVDDLNNCFVDEGEGGTSRTETITGRDNQDLYWGVRAANAPAGASWAVRRFRIEPGSASTVRLFDDTGYNGTYVEVNDPGLYTVADSFNDRTESIVMPDNWAVRLFKHDDYNGPETCITNNDSDLWNNYFSDGSVVANQTTWFEVYDQSDCPPIITPPDTPSLYNPSDGATFDEGESINLSWSDTGDEYYGEVWGGPAGTSSFGWQTGTSRNIGSQWPGYVYSWHVKARNGAGTSGWSTTREFTVRPAAPSGLSATAISCNEVELQWSDNSGGEEGYKIYRDGTYIGQVGADVTSYNDVGVGESTSYSYYVKAFRGSISSSASNSANVSTPACPTIGPLVYDSHTVDDDTTDQSDGDGDGVVECGERIELYVSLRNEGNTTAPGVSASIATNDAYASWLHNTNSDYGDIFGGGTGTNSDDFDLQIAQDTPDGHVIHLSMTASDENGNSWSDSFDVSVSCPIPDLEPYAPSGYQYPVVPASVSGTTENDTLLAGDFSTYFDWHFKNTGWASAPGTFYVELWIDSERFIRYPYGTYWPGQFGGFDDWQIPVPEPGWHTVRIVVDADDTVEELSENNNVWERQFYWESTCGDTGELNNDYTQATSMSYGETRQATICPSGEYDFYQFTGNAGDRIVVDINAQVNDSALDSYVYLLDSDGTTVLAQNDDESGGILDSHLSYELSHDGVYYIKVRDYYHPSTGGSDYFYDISLVKDNVDPLAEIATPVTDAWIDGSSQAIVADVSDADSGIRNVRFYWHESDWSTDWVVLGDDWNPDDGWSYVLDTSGFSEQRGGAFYIYAYDWAGNYIGAASWNIGIDRTPPVVPTLSTQALYGDAPFRDFHLWWSSWDNLSGIDTYDVQYLIDGSSGWTDLALDTTDTYTRFLGGEGHTYYFRARGRDHAGNLSLYSTGDISHTVDICAVSADAYESDNAAYSASLFELNGYPQIHNIHAEGDEDWIRFVAQSGVTYTLTTGNMGRHADTVLELYDVDGSTLLAANDDCPDRWPASCLDWQAPGDGTYYVRINHWDPWAYGCTTKYGLSITSNESPSLALGEPGTALRYIDTQGTVNEPYLSDAQHLNWPHSVAVDSGGNLYVTEVAGQRLMKFDSNGQLLWFFGEAGIDSRDPGYLAYPHGVAVDETWDRVYVADNDAHTVRVFDTSGNQIQTLGVVGEAGSDNDHFNAPKGVTVSADGTLYVSDTGNHRVQIFDNLGNYLHTLGTGYGSGEYEFRRPAGVVLDGNGHLYVADSLNHRVQIFTTDRVYSATLGTTGEAGSDNTHFDQPAAVNVDGTNNLYVVDSGNHRIQRFDSSLNYVDTLGESGVSGTDNAHFNDPSGLAVGAGGTLYVADGANHRVQAFSPGFVYLYTLGESGVPYQTDAQHLNHPGDIAVDAAGNQYIIEYFGHRLLKLRPDGTLLASVGTPGVADFDNAHFNWPQGVAVSGDGTVYVADTVNHRVQVFNSTLDYQTTLGTGTCGDQADEFCGPHKVAVDGDGRLYVADTWNHRVQVFNSSHELVATVGMGEPGSDNMRFYHPRAVAVNDEGDIYVVDEVNKRIQRCRLQGDSGVCTTFAGETGVDGNDFVHFRAPLDVAVDGAGRVYVNDSYWNQRIQVFDTSGAYLATIGGVWGSEHGEFRNPNGISIAPDGRLCVADTDNMRIEYYLFGVPNWTSTNINGFGNPRTTGVSALAEFGEYLYAGASNWNSGAQLWRSANGTAWEDITPPTLVSNAVTDLSAFDGALYASTGWGGDSQIWRSVDGATWTVIVTDGFGDGDTDAVSKLTVFDGYLYAATGNTTDGFAIWRSVTGNTGSWIPVLASGDGNTNNHIATGLIEFDSDLYVAAENGSDGVGIWRSTDGTSWEQVVSGGFGDANNTETGGFAVFDGYLYIGTRNDVTGAQLWRSTDGSAWSPVMANGFGDAGNRKIESLSVAYDALYAVTYNGTAGAEVLRSEDGVTWESSAIGGWGDPENFASLWNNATVFFNDQLYVGTWNEAHGGEIWRSDLQLARAGFSGSPLSGVAPLTVQFINQASGDYDTCEWDFGDGESTTSCTIQDHTYSEVGTYTVSLAISGIGGEDIEIKEDYIEVREMMYVYLPLTLRNE